MRTKDWKPTRLPGIFGLSKMTVAERKGLLILIPQTGRILEIGTHSGATATWLAKQRPRVQFIGLDIFVAKDAAFGLPAVRNSQQCENYQIFVGTTTQFEKLNPAKFDLIVVDANHHYTPVLNDLQMAMPLLTPGGVLLAHDYTPNYPGVVRAVNKFTQTHHMTIELVADRLVRLR